MMLEHTRPKRGEKNERPPICAIVSAFEGGVVELLAGVLQVRLAMEVGREASTDVKSRSLPPKVKPPTPTAEFLPPTTARPFSSRILETSIHLAPAPMAMLDPSSEGLT